MESKDWSGFGYFSLDFSPRMLGRRKESFGVLSAIQRNPWLQVNFVSFQWFWPRYGKNITVIGVLINIRTLKEKLEMRWKYLLTDTAQGKMWGSERKPDWLEMFSKFSELKL